MDDVDPERSFTSGSNETLTCTFYSNPAVESVTWYDGPDDQGDLIHIDGLEPNAEDKYISTFFLENIMFDRNVTCVATQLITNTTNAESRIIKTTAINDNMFTYYLHILTNTGINI